MLERLENHSEREAELLSRQTVSTYATQEQAKVIDARFNYPLYLFSKLNGNESWDGDLASVRVLAKREHPTWTNEFLDEAIKGYRRFLMACKNNPTLAIIPNEPGVDDVWHAHILHMEDYARDCMSIFDGEMLVHNPHTAKGEEKTHKCSASHCDYRSFGRRIKMAQHPTVM